ncbi:MAG: ribosome recycling factor [Clostridia bacterium]|nr:ribosome recycling factor [Clostridia bacterium]
MKEIMSNLESKMEKSIDSLKGEFATVRAGRANPAILDKITVDYYGNPTPLNQVGTIAVPDPRMITIQPWDGSLLPLIEKAIQKSDLGINPTNDGKMVRLSFPAPTEERRKELVKDVHKIAENAKVAVRNLRRDAIDKLKAKKKANEITEDDVKSGEEQIQKITDKYIKVVDSVLKEKEAEILTI